MTTFSMMPAANLFHRFRRLRRVSKSLSHALALLGGLLVFVPVIAIAAQGLSAINLVTTTEYYYTPLDYYFITSRDSDKAALDGISGWTRTGRSFTAFSTPVAGTSGLTRYYFDKVAVNATRGSHFYTVLDSDRDTLAARNPTNSPAATLPYFEGNDSFAYPPVASGASGSCPVGTQTVYRVFRGNAKFPDNPNHRFTTELALYQQFVKLGWDAEGVNFLRADDSGGHQQLPTGRVLSGGQFAQFLYRQKSRWQDELGQ